MEIVGR